MRIAFLLPCLLLTACLADGNPPAPEASMVAAAPTAAVSAKPLPEPSAAAAKPRPSGTRAGGSAAGGGATTAAQSQPVEVGPDVVVEARAECWMKVEHEKLRDIDKRIAFVDKCVANAMKAMQ